MACGHGLTAEQCRAQHIALRLRDAKPDGGDFEARCPVCGHGGFRISQARVRSLRHIWTCACRRCRCDDPAALRSALLRLGVMPGCLGSYGTRGKTGFDLTVAAELVQAVDDILAAPHLRPSDIRIILAEARGQKVPADYRSFVKWAMSIGIGQRQAYEAAQRWCRPTDMSSPSGGGTSDT